jgi:hypothetical protein
MTMLNILLHHRFPLGLLSFCKEPKQGKARFQKVLPDARGKLNMTVFFNLLESIGMTEYKALLIVAVCNYMGLDLGGVSNEDVGSGFIPAFTLFNQPSVNQEVKNNATHYDTNDIEGKTAVDGGG